MIEELQKIPYESTIDIIGDDITVMIWNPPDHLGGHVQRFKAYGTAEEVEEYIQEDL